MRLVRACVQYMPCGWCVHVCSTCHAAGACMCAVHAMRLVRACMWAMASNWCVHVCRFGIGRFSTDEEVDYTIKHCVASVNRLREMR
jgi:cysteine sulfinate desulfinase/cysteine desulfurase-like protein